VDRAGHAWGPDSVQVEAALATVDAALWRLIGGLNASGLLGRTHLLVVSDHGMSATDASQRQLPLERILPPDVVAAAAALRGRGASLEGSHIAFGCPNADAPCDAAAAAALAGRVNAFARGNDCAPPGAAAPLSCGDVFSAHAKGSLPAAVGRGYGASSRVMPVVGLPALGWVVSSSAAAASTASAGGQHGWPPSYGSMAGLAIGVGPRFARGSVWRSPAAAMAETPAEVAAAGAAVPNVELYALMAELLGVPPAPHNGTAGYPTAVLLPVCK